MQEGFRARISPDFALVALLCAVSFPAAAADVSPWDNDIRSAVRLIGGSAISESGTRILRAGVEIRLQSGWKTYWRYPGDAGVPPAFDFSSSDNVKSATVLWPAPVRFPDGSGNSIGYKGSAIFPLRIVPRDPAKPVKLRLKLDYAVCETLCVPAKGKAELALSGAAGSQEAALKAAEARVPKPRAVGEGAALAIRKAWRDAASAKPRVLVDVVAPAGIEVDLFAEGPTPGTGAKAQGAAVKLTATSGQEAIEAVFRLD
jgi:DsbC/DsbD-like thiol-disulfide interchange protein